MEFLLIPAELSGTKTGDGHGVTVFACRFALDVIVDDQTVENNVLSKT